MSDRMTPERLAEIQRSVANPGITRGLFDHRYLAELLAELDAVNRERDEARKECERLDEVNDALQRELDSAYDDLAEYEQ